jgi:hypothetical protein
MASKCEIKDKIVKTIIEPAFEPSQIEKIARTYGYDIHACFISEEFKNLLERVTTLMIGQIEQFLKTQEAFEIDHQASSLKAREIFASEIENRLSKICTINPRPHGGYHVLWSWRDLISFFTSKN